MTASPSRWLAAAALAALATGTACRAKAPQAPPVATPTLTLGRTSAPVGSPIEMTYRFVVASDAAFTEDDRVMLHVVDADGELLWADDHQPPVPTREWKPGQTVEYRRTTFVPSLAYVGEARVQVGLYSTADQRRLAMTGDDNGQRAYAVAHLQLAPQSENVLTVFKDGWQPAESAAGNAAVEWQWTTKTATLAFRNPKRDAVLYLDVDSPDPSLHPAQQVQVVMGGQPVDTFTLKPDERLLRVVALPAAQMGETEMAEIQFTVDAPFVPSLVSGSTSKDARQLGVRVFHAFIDVR